MLLSKAGLDKKKEKLQRESLPDWAQPLARVCAPKANIMQHNLQSNYKFTSALISMHILNIPGLNQDKQSPQSIISKSLLMWLLKRRRLFSSLSVFMRHIS